MAKHTLVLEVNDEQLENINQAIRAQQLDIVESDAQLLSAGLIDKPHPRAKEMCEEWGCNTLGYYIAHICLRFLVYKPDDDEDHDEGEEWKNQPGEEY